MTRGRLITILAEVVQELCQPLSAITCSIDMITSRTLGDISQPQADMLNLAYDSAGKIRTLVDNLEKIAGLPTTLSPDEEIQKALYE
jgi:hypothetical protein